MEGGTPRVSWAVGSFNGFQCEGGVSFVNKGGDGMACWRPREVLDRFSVDEGLSASRIEGIFDCRRRSARAANLACEEVG